MYKTSTATRLYKYSLYLLREQWVLFYQNRVQTHRQLHGYKAYKQTRQCRATKHKVYIDRLRITRNMIYPRAHGNRSFVRITCQAKASFTLTVRKALRAGLQTRKYVSHLTRRSNIIYNYKDNK